jgi:hypothetical protein
MQQPVDVPLSFLKNLNKSKAVMEMAESVKKTSPNQPTTQGFLDEQPTEYLSELPQGMVNESYGAPSRSTEPRPISKDMIQNSKLPDSIKKIMSENIIETPDMFVSENNFNLSNVRMDLMGGGEKEVEYKQPSSLNELMQNKKKVIPTQQQTSTSNVNEETIRNIVRDEIVRIMSESYTKKIKEDTVKKTIMTLKKKGLLK